MQRRERPMTMIAVKVEGVGLDSNHGPVVVLREIDGERVLPIWIGHAEAASIQMKLDGQEYIRPLTHDLIQNILEGLGSTLTQIEITAIKDSTYFAQLTIVNGNGDEVKIDARPSDSIAMALRADANIFVDESLFRITGLGVDPQASEGGHGEQGESDEEQAERKRQELRRRLRDIDPGDFGSFRLGG